MLYNRSWLGPGPKASLMLTLALPGSIALLTFARPLAVATVVARPGAFVLALALLALTLAVLALALALLAVALALAAKLLSALIGELHPLAPALESLGVLGPVLRLRAVALAAALLLLLAGLTAATLLATSACLAAAGHFSQCLLG